MPGRSTGVAPDAGAEIVRKDFGPNGHYLRRRLFAVRVSIRDLKTSIKTPYVSHGIRSNYPVAWLKSVGWISVIPFNRRGFGAGL